jgi:phage tail-like protein
MAQRKDPYRNFRFRLEIDAISQAGFSEVAIAETSTDAIDYREGPDPTHARKLPGMTKYGNITLKWGFTDSVELWKWYAAIVAGQIETNRKTVNIIVQDETGADKARFTISNAWPVKYHPTDLNAKGNDVYIEMVELANEGVERVQ